MERLEFIIEGSSNKPLLVDISFERNNLPKKIVVFSHGFKGFKDWGPFNKIAEYFANHNIFFLKFNFSHNGTSPKYPLDFNDMSAFGNNNFCKELDDLSYIISWLSSNKKFRNEIDIDDLHLFGHSRGGAISILKSLENDKIKSVVSWASPSDLLKKLPTDDKLLKWKETNIAYVYNGRTKQNMPMYYQFYENCINNFKRLDIEYVIKNMKIPHLIVHGSEDPTVSINDAQEMKNWNNNISLNVIQGADHVFGATHPYNLNMFSLHLEEAVNSTLNFLEG